MNEPEHLLRNLFAEALEISDARQRAAFLDRECREDVNLRREVEELIQAEAKAGYFLPEKPATTGSGTALRDLVGALGDNDGFPTAPPTEKPGDRIGRFLLLEKIGEGGCGVVYLAGQEEPVRRRVALKVIKLGMDTRSVVARFEAERQALALMDHANIAKVFDAGATDTGRPFFVMELVKGTRITDYCDQHRLSTQERLELFIQVCQAVQHAHQKGIIHRDLKPSNILVTVSDGVAVPKVIDFGIAKATEGRLADHTLFTAFEQFIGTPAYMSPEQAAMTSQDIDTRSDIYSLGVLLYELLTGNTPFDSKELLAAGVDEMRRTLREKEPKRPSTRLTQALVAADVTRRTSGGAEESASSRRRLQEQLHQLKGDLDWVVMKCLEKDRTRRYETASGLAADLQRHLNNEPVVARPPGNLYRLQKFARRNRVTVTAAIAVVAALLVGLAFATVGFVQARHQRDLSNLRAYASDMNLAQQAWDDGNLKRARTLLEAHIPNAGETDLRGFEWRYLWKLCQRDESLRTVNFEADNPVRGQATSPAHSFIAAACDKTIRLLEPSTGRELVRFSYPNREAKNSWHALALAAGATNLLAAHRAEGVVGLWDVASRELLMKFQAFTNNVGVLALSPDGNLLAAADRRDFYGTALRVWDISSRSQPPLPVWSFPTTNGITALAFSPSGEFLVAAGAPHTYAPLDIFEATKKSEPKRITNASAGNINALAFSPDGTLLASSGIEGRINIWNFTNRTFKFDFEGHASTVDSLGFSSDGTRLVSGGEDGTIRLWDIPSQRPAGMWRLSQSSILEAFFAGEGKSIVSVAPDGLKIWKPEPQQPATLINVQPGWSYPIVSPDNKSVIVSGVINAAGLQGAAVWDIASGQHKFDLVCKGIGSHSLAFSPNRRFFALGGLEKEGLVGLWDTSAWEKGASRVEPFTYLTNGFEAGSICFSPDGDVLAVAGRSFPPYSPEVPSGATNRLAFWQVGSWEKLDILPQAGAGVTEWAAAATAVFSPAGRLLAVGSRDGWVRLWDVKRGRQLKEFKAHGENIFGVQVTFSSDNRWLASLGAGDDSLVLFDLADLEHPRPVPLGRDEPGEISSMLFAPDNKSLITASGDGLIKFWNLQTRRVVLTLRHSRGPGGWLALSPDGNLLVSKDARGLVKLWPATPLAEIPRFKPVEKNGVSK